MAYDDSARRYSRPAWEIQFCPVPGRRPAVGIDRLVGGRRTSRVLIVGRDELTGLIAACEAALAQHEHEEE